MTGAFSVKFVGLSVILLVGVRTIYDLWVILGDMSKPVVKQIFWKNIPLYQTIESYSTTYCVISVIYRKALHSKGNMPYSFSSCTLHGDILCPFEDP